MISSVAWLPRGVAKAVPELAQPSGKHQLSQRLGAAGVLAPLTLCKRAEEELAAAQARANEVLGQEDEEEDDDSDDAGEGASSDDEAAEQDDAAAAAGPQGLRGGRAGASAQGAWCLCAHVCSCGG